MFTIRTTSFENIIVSIIAFLLMMLFVVIIMKAECLYKRIYPSVTVIIATLTVIRLMIPFEFAYSHCFVYRGPLRHIFMEVNSAWDKNDIVLHYFSYTHIAFVIWFVGAIVYVVKISINYYRAMKCTKLMSKDVTEVLISDKEISEENKSMIISRRIRIISIPGIASPVTCGLFKPLILIPENKGLGGGDYQVILSHELMHIRKGDLVKKIFVLIIKLIYWWFPPVGLLLDYNSLAIEMQVDKKASGTDKKAYLTGILNVMELQNDIAITKNDRIICLHPIALFTDESDMKKRFNKLLYKGNESIILSALFLIVAITVYISSYLFSFQCDYTYEEQSEIAKSEGFYIPNPTNAYIIERNDGKYEEFFSFDGDIYFFTGEYDSLDECSEGLPIYNEKGDKIEWPFFHK